MNALREVSGKQLKSVSDPDALPETEEEKARQENAFMGPMGEEPPSILAKYFSISRDMGPSAVMHTGAVLRILDTRASLILSPRVSFTKSSTSLASWACFSCSAFSSSVS